MKYEKSCGGIVIDNGQVLLIKHKLGHWDMPKGHMENGESDEETAIREIKEETNIDITIDTSYRYEIVYSPKPGVEKLVVYFLATPTSFDIKIQEEEVSIAKFVSIDEAIDLITYDNTRNILKSLIKDMNKNNEIVNNKNN